MTEFRYDLHIHTRETSRCGHISAADMVKSYKALGYSGIAITDHFHEDYIKTLPFKDDWNKCISAYLAGYRLAKEAAASLDFDVILGMELRLTENSNDYLVYGFTEDFLRSHPYLFRTNICAFYQTFKDQALIIQAHPYRGGMNLQPQCLHGLEVINCNQRHENHNDLAFKLAAEQPLGFIRICASDAHKREDIGRASMIFPARIKDSSDLAINLKSGNYRMDCPEYKELLNRNS